MRLNQVRKFEVQPYDGKRLLLPRSAELLHVGTQINEGVEAVYVWALVDIDADLVERRIAAFGTGHNLPEDALVFHLFDFGEASVA
jgi:hypothetical protein